jgi:hypothetical protein
MKISFPKYGPVELLTRKQGAASIIGFVASAFFAGVCGSYFLANKWWLLAIGMLGIAGILLFLGAAAAIFLNQNKVNEVPSAPIEENVPRFTPQWDYRPRKPIRGRGVFDSRSTKTSDDLSPDPFEINNNVWFNDNSLEDAASTFIDGPPETEEAITEALPPTTDLVRSALTVENTNV